MSERGGTGIRTIGLVAIVAAAGAAGTVVVAAALGVGSSERTDLIAYLAPAVVVTVIAGALARVLLARASLGQRFVAVALIAAGVAIANIGVLSVRMTVSDHDATLISVLLLYSAAAGVAGALVVARSSAAAIERLGRAARRMGEGDLETRIGPLDAGPELDMLASTLDDMAERLERSLSREREAEAMRRDLITTVSHDLRTPLASLRAMVEAIDDGVVADTPSLQRYAEEMRRSVRQLSAMIDDLFELTQLEAGAIEAETARARLDEVVTTAVAAVGMTASEKGLSLQTEIAGAEDVGCSPRIARVLQNLLVNAVRHTPADGTVRIEAARRGDRLLLAVEDSGDGIPAEDLPRIFDPFFRGDPARSGPGAGLGLALAKRIVEALGGRIEAKSTPTSGARFAIDLPAATVSEVVRGT
jgi:signal transduction histidine kinase